MGHKTLIGGTAYEISGGKTLVGGTAYSIKNGKTLVDGTAYEVGFGPAMATITLPDGTDSYWSSGRYEIHGSVSGDGISGNTSEVPVGTVITCTLSNGDYDNGYITLNGTVVASGYIADNESVTYDYTVTGNATITLTKEGYYYYIRITEE